MLACLFAVVLVWQEPDPKPAPARAPDAVPAPKVVEAWDDKVAKAAVDAFAAAMKGSPSMAQKNQALEGLAKGSNALLVKPLADVAEKDKSLVIQRRAAELLANQPVKAANPVIRKLLKSERLADKPSVVGDLVRALAKCGYDEKQWNDVAVLLERDYRPECIPLHEAVLELVTKHKERQALPMLLRNIDEPAPDNEHDASNPPKEYWEARWKSWSAWKGKVKDALFAITGQRFSTSAEAKTWLEANRK